MPPDLGTPTTFCELHGNLFQLLPSRTACCITIWCVLVLVCIVWNRLCVVQAPVATILAIHQPHYKPPAAAQAALQAAPPWTGLVSVGAALRAPSASGPAPPPQPAQREPNNLDGTARPARRTARQCRSKNVTNADTDEDYDAGEDWEQEESDRELSGGGGTWGATRKRHTASRGRPLDTEGARHLAVLIKAVRDGTPQKRPAPVQTGEREAETVGQLRSIKLAANGMLGAAMAGGARAGAMTTAAAASGQAQPGVEGTAPAHPMDCH